MARLRMAGSSQGSTLLPETGGPPLCLARFRVRPLGATWISYSHPRGAVEGMRPSPPLVAMASGATQLAGAMDVPKADTGRLPPWRGAMREIRTEIEVDAPVERVWRVLTDFQDFGEWNPFIVRAEGEPRRGERLAVTIRPPGRKATTFRPTVVAHEPNRELRWLGRVDSRHLRRRARSPGEGPSGWTNQIRSARTVPRNSGPRFSAGCSAPQKRGSAR